MKSLTTILPTTAVLGGLLGLSPSVSAALVTQEEFPGVSVPDGDPAGRSRTMEVVAPGLTVVDVNVSLTLTGAQAGWNGDLYAWLRHEGGAFGVLLNRPGRTGINPDGYADNGLLNVVFDDTAAEDIHTYQVSWSGGPGPLTGTWQPDARNVDPDTVTDASPRTTFLNVFNGGPAGGKWTLFVADLSGGFSMTLNHWRLDITVVPEPADAVILAGVALLGFGFWRQRTANSPRTG